MDRREAAARIEEIRGLMARAGEYRHLSGWAAVANGLLVFAGCAVSNKIVLVSFYPGNDPRKLAAVWGPVAALGLVLDVLLTVALARRRGEPAWSPAARQMLAGLLPGLYAGAVVTVFLIGDGYYEALPGAWMVCYGTALMGASLFSPWEVRYFGLAFLLFGGAALMFLRDYAMWSMGLGFGVLHLAFGAYVLWRYRGGHRAGGKADRSRGGEGKRGGTGDGDEPWDTGNRWEPER
jgi:hypothetical protein